MKINLEEISALGNKMSSPKDFENFVCDIEESLDFEELRDEISLDFKHLINDWILSAIKCGFSREVLSIDYGINSEIIDLLENYKNYELEVDL